MTRRQAERAARNMAVASQSILRENEKLERVAQYTTDEMNAARENSATLARALWIIANRSPDLQIHITGKDIVEFPDDAMLRQAYDDDTDRVSFIAARKQPELIIAPADTDVKAFAEEQKAALELLK